MKKYLSIAVLAVLFASCSNNFQQSAKDAEKQQNKPSAIELSKMEAMFFGYDQKNIQDSSIIVKIKASNNEEVNNFVHSLKVLNVEKTGTEEGFVADEMYVFVKALDDYPETLKKIRSIDGVIYAEPNYKMQLIDSCSERKNNFYKGLVLADGDLKKDPEGEMKEYALEITGALKAYKKFGYGTHTVWAGILDTGTNANHEDLQGEDGKTIVKVLKTAFSDPKNLIIAEDKTGNTDNDAVAGHGTHCTGSICAVGNNDKGMAGVAWKNVNFASYKVMKDGGTFDQAVYGCLRDLTDTIRKTVSQDVQATIPVNMSLGGLLVSNYAIEHINYALSKGVLPVVANGNDGELIASYPAACPGVLSVGASGDNDKKAGFSTYGPWLNVVAPGLNIISLGHETENNVYKYASGTSQAAPFVTGLVAYLLSFDPTLTPYQIITILEKTADKIDANKNPLSQYDENGFSMLCGHGRVNVYKATKMVTEKQTPQKGKNYVETVLHIDVPIPNAMIHIYEKNTGVLVSMTLSYNDKTPQAEIRGLRPGVYNVVFNQKWKEVTIGNDRDTKVTF